MRVCRAARRQRQRFAALMMIFVDDKAAQELNDPDAVVPAE
ncbi:hypothetical protein [Fodinibius sp.]|nr:hypothetical protein [Fodinibius sp.]MDZ7660085.1 hypothetical protein [Fodinibius sp.]